MARCQNVMKGIPFESQMFGMSKAVAERSNVGSKEVESVLPLQTTVSK